MTENEKLLLEATKSYLSSIRDIKDDKKATNDDNTKMRGFEYLYNHINDLFHSKTADLTHHTGICAAFAKVHSYQYIDKPAFIAAIKKEMDAIGVPKNEQTKALDTINKIKDELESDDIMAERDFGFNQNLDELQDAGQPDTEEHE